MSMYKFLQKNRKKTSWLTAFKGQVKTPLDIPVLCCQTCHITAISSSAGYSKAAHY